jgi:hypothetical protein
VSNEDQSEISDEEIANFMKKLKKGTGRYKGKFPLICFNCGKIGHFSSKCPYPKQEESDDERTFKEQKKSQTKDKRKVYKKKKTFYTEENNNSSEESEEEEESEHLFMGIETQNNHTKNTFDIEEENSEVEGEVDLEAELISALDELRKYKKKNKLLRGQLLEFEQAQQTREKEVSKTIKESEKIIIDLKTQLQEVKRNKEILNEQFKEKQQVCKKLEDEISQLKGELERGNHQSKFENSSNILNDILNNQRSPNDKAGLGYDQNSTSTAQKTDKKSINYADALRNPLKREDNKMKMAPLKIVFNKKAPPPKGKGNTVIRRMVSEGKGNTVIRRTPPNRYQHIFLGYFIHATTLDTKKYIVKPIETTNQEMSKDIRTTRMM